MYRQVNIMQSQRDLQRIVWRSEPNLPLKHYRLNTITYDTASASFLSTRCLKQLSIENEKAYPKAAYAITKDFYMDDLLAGANSIEKLLKLKQY
ncbi:hypothetical protein QE152_g10316 [Popillia japonica]|uniref:Uncharacterized protein n=1 Tax=Popillia japonica TaxID=7064 RepID=A0AAW1LVY7_POPJA